MRNHTVEYQEYLRRKGFSERYVQGMKWQVRGFYVFLLLKGIKNINRETIQKYRDYVIDEYRTFENKKLSSVSVESKLQAIKGYFRYLVLEKKFLFDPTVGLQIPRGRNSLARDVPTDKKIQKIIDGISTIREWGKRDKAILELLYSSGIRARELLGLDLYDIDFQNGKVMIRNGKGNKDRIIPFGKRARNALKEYFKGERGIYLKNQREQAVFIRGNGTRLNAWDLQNAIRRHRGEVKMTSHSLRHACALGMLRNGADIRFIQAMLGHARLETTQIYTRLQPIELKEAHKKYHPREKKQKEIH